MLKFTVVNERINDTIYKFKCDAGYIELYFNNTKPFSHYFVNKKDGVEGKLIEDFIVKYVHRNLFFNDERIYELNYVGDIPMPTDKKHSIKIENVFDQLEINFINKFPDDVKIDLNNTDHHLIALYHDGKIAGYFAYNDDGNIYVDNELDDFIVLSIQIYEYVNMRIPYYRKTLC